MKYVKRHFILEKNDIENEKKKITAKKIENHILEQITIADNDRREYFLAAIHKRLEKGRSWF